MILDKLENLSLHTYISVNLKKGFKFLTNNDLSNMKVGRYDIEGDDVFALVSEYSSKEPQDCLLEAHHIYTDIQYIVSGRESIGYAILKNQAILTTYNPDKDIIFYSGETTPLILIAGMFAIFFPQDLHRPCMQIDGPEIVKKVVIKVKL